MKNNTFFILLLISQILASLIILVFHAFILPSALVSDFIVQWAGFGTIRLIIETWPVVLLWVVILRFSLFPSILGETRTTLEKDESIPGFKKTIVTGVSWLLFMAIIGFIVHPISVEKQNSALYRSRQSRDQLQIALNLESQGNILAAMNRIDNAFSLTPGFIDVQIARDRIYRAVVALPVNNPVDGVRPPLGLALNLTFGDLLMRAETFLQQEDYFSAVYYADQALLLSGMEQEPRALAIRQDARRRIQAIELSGGDIRSQQRFFQKRLALNALEEARYIESYYIMKALSDEDSQDTDVLEWFPVIREALNRVSFFVDHATFALEHGDVGGPIAWEHRETEGGRVWIYSAARTARNVFRPPVGIKIPPGSSLMDFYLYDLEFAVIDSMSGSLIAQGTAPYGRASYLTRPENESLWMLQTVAISQESPGIQTQIQWEGNTEIISSDQDEMFWELGIAVLPVDPEMLFAVGSALAAPESMNLARLFSSLHFLESLGYDSLPLEMEFFSRILIPLIDIVLFIFILGYGWSGRIRTPGVNLIIAFSALPLLILVLFLMRVGLVWFFRIVLSVCISVFGLGIGLLVLGVGLLAVSLVIILVVGVKYSGNGVS